MALLLCLETSTHAFSCALFQDQKLIAFEESGGLQTTAALMTVFVDKLFEDNRLKKNQLSAAVVASGPGSYTGLRIGVATAKGICYALSIPLISVNTLHLMAHQFICQFTGADKDALLCPMLDARRMEVYCTLLSKDGSVVDPTQAMVIDGTSFSNHLDQHRIYFFGEGSVKCKNLISHDHAIFFPGIKPSAKNMGSRGYEKYLKSEFEDLIHFEPLYLKDFIIKKPKLIF